MDDTIITQQTNTINVNKWTSGSCESAARVSCTAVCGPPPAAHPCKCDSIIHWPKSCSVVAHIHAAVRCHNAQSTELTASVRL